MMEGAEDVVNDEEEGKVEGESEIDDDDDDDGVEVKDSWTFGASSEEVAIFSSTNEDVAAFIRGA